MDVIAVVGPTAVGKSAAAVALAHLLPGAEIINADAMQLYRGMDVGTAKASPAEQQGIPHHLLDLWPVTHRASVAEYRAAAREAIGDISRRAGRPMVVGGSGLYLTAALDDLDIPATDPEVRARWEAELAARGPAALHEELAGRDPKAAAAIDPRNGRRLVRALEVVELRGSFTARLPQPAPSWRPTAWLGLTAPLADLDERIERRARQMWAGGLLAEVERLVDEGLRDGPTAGAAVGYSEGLAVLAGEMNREEAIESTIVRTRRLARRQLRWFRRDQRIVWHDTSSPGWLDRFCSAAEVA